MSSAQRKHEELGATSSHELELSQRLVFQRQSALDQISRALIDKLDIAQMSPEVLEKIAQLFEADVIAAWIAENNGHPRFVLKDAFGFTAHNVEQLEATEWSFPRSSRRTRSRTNLSRTTRRKRGQVRSSMCVAANASFARR